MLLSPGCWQSILRLLGNGILNAVAGLFRTGLDTLGRDLGSMTNVFGAPLRGLADFRSRMPNDMTGLGCGFVHVVGSILANRHTYAENQQCGNPCNC
jgi:hypothetical protein